MKNKKILLYYLLEFILTILFFITIFIIVLKITILNKNYIHNIVDKNNYVHELYLDMNNDFENYIMQSGFSEDILDGVVIEEELNKIIHNNVESFYSGMEVKVYVTGIKEKINTNINNYLEKNNIKITDQESLDLFINEVIGIYNDRIILNNYFMKYSTTFYKIKNNINIVFYILIILDLILFFLIKLIFKKITLSIPVITSIILLILFYYMFFSKININNIIFWNTYLSSLIKCVLSDISNIIKYIIIGGLIIEFLKIIYLLIRKSSGH